VVLDQLDDDRGDRLVVEGGELEEAVDLGAVGVGVGAQGDQQDAVVVRALLAVGELGGLGGLAAADAEHGRRRAAGHLGVGQQVLGGHDRPAREHAVLVGLDHGAQIRGQLADDGPTPAPSGPLHAQRHVAEEDLIARGDRARLGADGLAVDPRAVRGAEVADEDPLALQVHLGVPARDADLVRGQAARRVAPDEEARVAFVERRGGGSELESCRLHGRHGIRKPARSQRAAGALTRVSRLARPRRRSGRQLRLCRGVPAAVPGVA
jgi:hypothetical protein